MSGSGSIHRRVAFRMLLVTLAMSVVTAALVYLYGQNRIEGYVITLAEAEAGVYKKSYGVFADNPTPEALGTLRSQLKELILASRFIVLEMYDATGKKVASAEKPGAKEIEEQLPSHGKKFTESGSVVHEPYYLGDTLYLRVFVPVSGNGDASRGYFEGIYRVDPEVLKRLRGAVTAAIVIVIAVVFVTSLVLYPVILSLYRGLVHYSIDLTQSNIGTLEALGSAIAKRDSDTNSHNYRVTLYALKLGELFGLPKRDLQQLMKGAFLHDVGKIAIPDAILHKNGRLTPEEFAQMKTHVSHGVEIVGKYAWLKDAEDVVRCHHEKFDGSGYLSGLPGKEIPLVARIFIIADIFDALTSKRPYKEPWPLDKCIAELEAERGRAFDPAIVDLFITHARRLYEEICIDDDETLRVMLGNYVVNLFAAPSVVA